MEGGVGPCSARALCGQSPHPSVQVTPGIKGEKVLDNGSHTEGTINCLEDSILFLRLPPRQGSNLGPPNIAS